MMSSCMLINMACLFSVRTIFCGVYSLASTVIQQIILRSMVPFFTLRFTHLLGRMLLLCLKNLGEYLCPRCEVPKKWVSDVGTVNDMTRRAKIRLDDSNRREAVENARAKIFKKGFAVNSVKVQRLLKKGSLTPSRVCVPSSANISIDH
jgi:hypothetical protein